MNKTNKTKQIAALKVVALTPAHLVKIKGGETSIPAEY
jgi:hypothetical protein